MVEERRDPEAPAEDGERSSEDRPAAPVRAAGPGRDRGRTAAMAVLVALVALGVALIARGPRGGAGQVAAGGPGEPGVLTSAELPVTAVGASAVAATPAATAAPDVDAGAPFTPAWRVAVLERDPKVEVLRGIVGKRALSGALLALGMAKAEVRRITRAVEGIRRIERGAARDTFAVARDRATGTAVGFEYAASPTDVWQARDEDGVLVAKKLELFVEKKRTAASLQVVTELSKAIAAAGLRPEVLGEIEEALEGQADTAAIKPGARLRVVGHEQWVEGELARFEVEALELVPRSGAPLRLYFYERDAAVEGSRRRAPHPGFYDAKGQQPFRGTFRSPLPLARVTSRFNPKRMHPVLHVVTPHNGVDFGASTGTPVYASGAGTVQSAGDSGPCGNMVQIEHANGLTTAYCHLSRFAAGLHPGQHVEARQLVGYVGQTGRATGPHLHFAVKRGATFLDPLVLKLDGVRTLPPSDREGFARRRAELDAALEAVPLPAADGAPPDDKDDPKDEPAGEE